MPFLVVKVKSSAYPEIRASGKVETLRDLRRLFKLADKRIGDITRMFPNEVGAKVERVTVSAE